MTSMILLVCSLLCNIAALGLMIAQARKMERKEEPSEPKQEQPTVQSDPIMDDLMRIMTYTGADDHE